MLSNPDQAPKKISRRDFLIATKDKALQIGAAMLVIPTIGASTNQPSPEQAQETIEPVEEIFTHKIIDGDFTFELSFKALPIKPTSPYISNDGKYYDLAKKQYVNIDQCTPDMLLLGNGPAFVDGRDTMITPDFVINPITEKIIATGMENINKYVRQASRNNINTGVVEVGGIVTESKVETDENVNFTPSKLLKLRQFEKAIADTLNYDREAPYKVIDLSLADRLKAGATNCQEFSITTAMILAGEPLYMPSEILHFGYQLPTGEIEKLIKQKEKDKGSKLSDEELKILQNPNRAHVCNVINFNGTPVIIDSTSFGDGPSSLADYFGKYIKNDIKITTPIKFTSVLAQNSYQAFPWHDAEWVNAEAILSIQEAGKSES